MAITVHKTSIGDQMPNHILSEHEIEVYTLSGGVEQLPAGSCAYLELQAKAANADTIQLLTNQTDIEGWEIYPGQYKGPMVCQNVGRFYVLGTAGDKLVIHRWK